MKKKVTVFLLVLLMVLVSFAIPPVTAEAVEAGSGLNLRVHTQT